MEDDLLHRCETVGRVFDHVEAKVVDPNTGETLPVGQAGELCARGYIVMEGGYWGSEAQTKDVVDLEGWMHTGRCCCTWFQKYSDYNDMIILKLKPEVFVLTLHILANSRRHSRYRSRWLCPYRRAHQGYHHSGRRKHSPDRD